MKKPNGIKSVKVIQVIETEAEIGTGAKKDPVRMAIQYWGLDGTLLAVIDSCSFLKEPEPRNNSFLNQ